MSGAGGQGKSGKDNDFKLAYNLATINMLNQNLERNGDH